MQAHDHVRVCTFACVYACIGIQLYFDIYFLFSLSLFLQPGLLPSHVGKKQAFTITAKNKRGDVVVGAKFDVIITETNLNKRVPVQIVDGGNGVYTVCCYLINIFLCYYVCVRACVCMCVRGSVPLLITQVAYASMCGVCARACTCVCVRARVCKCACLRSFVYAYMQVFLAKPR